MPDEFVEPPPGTVAPPSALIGDGDRADKAWVIEALKVAQISQPTITYAEVQAIIDAYLAVGLDRGFNIMQSTHVMRGAF